MAKIRLYATDCCNASDCSQIFAFFALGPLIRTLANVTASDDAAIKINGTFFDICQT
jgi:hypothetical protein